MSPVVMLSALLAAVGSIRAEVIKGICYSPAPVNSTRGSAALPADDWFSDEAVPMWGNAGRADLAVMQKLGANMVRLYGNNPDFHHGNFLDEAWARGLSVAPGMSDYPYYQQVQGNCLQSTNFNCFTQVKPLYLQNLQNGFLTAAGSYHLALKYMSIINEPDLKMPSTACDSKEELYQMCRATITAFDAMLEAEQEAGVQGPLINFTATFSFGVCGSGEFFPGSPGLAQMAQLEDAMLNPEKYGYIPRNDIAAAYKARFTNSFSTSSPAWFVKSTFLDAYEAAFPNMPVYIAEYHSVGADQVEDLSSILQLAEDRDLFLGVSYFQYQVAYWKAGSERQFGMFGLEDQVVAAMPYISDTYDIYCLRAQASPVSGKSLPDAVAEAYGGLGISPATLCAANPGGVPLDQAGYLQIALQRSVPQMMLFVQLVLHHMGATVKQGHQAELERLATDYSGDVRSDAFSQMLDRIGSRAVWIAFDPEARCLADRNAAPSVVGSAIDWACSQEASLCSDLPSLCNSNTYMLGDYIFSRFARAVEGNWTPFVNCSFGGAALFAPKELYTQWSGASLCLDGATTTATSVSTSTTAASIGSVTTTGVIEATTASEEIATSTAADSMEGTTATTSRRSNTHLDMPTAAVAPEADRQTQPPKDPKTFLGSACEAIPQAWLLFAFFWSVVDRAL